MMLLGKGWILDGKLISTDDCLVSCRALCSESCMHRWWLTPAGGDWCNPNFLHVGSVSSHLLLSQTLHTQLHHLSAFQRLLIQMIGPNSLCPLLISTALFWESVMSLTMMCRAIFHLHFQDYFWNSLRALYFAGTVEWGQSGNAVKTRVKTEET